MKVVVHALMLIAIVVGTSACGKKGNEENNSGGQTVATVPQPSQRCLDTFSQSAWSPYQNFGFQPYGGYASYGGGNGVYVGGGFGMPTGHHPTYHHGRYPGQNMGQFSSPYPAWTPQRGFCGCPAGTVPTCDNSAGLACVNAQHINNMPYRAWGFDPVATNWNQLGWGQIPTQNSCHQGMAQACRVGTVSCGYGAVCMPTMNNSPMGVCVRH